LLDSEWNGDGIKSCYNFLKKSWHFIFNTKFCEISSERASKSINKLIFNIEDRISIFKFNTVVSAMMEFINEATTFPGEFSLDDLKKFIIVISPLVPHFSEEVWSKKFNMNTHVFHESFPVVDKNKLKNDLIEYVVQINGRVKFKLKLPENLNKDDVLKQLWLEDKFVKLIGDRQIKKEIFVPKKLISLVLS
ncbi:MAG: class I tRNA ligase family protein, partial [Firmicutes bacterium]|nr:class I tRNA ligase family protein [Bacillota bacterium]